MQELQQQHLFILPMWTKQVASWCFRAAFTLRKATAFLPVAVHPGNPTVGPMTTNASTNEKFRRLRPKPITCQTRRDDCARSRQLLAAKSLKLCLQRPLPRGLSRARAYPPQKAGWKHFGGKQPCMFTPCCSTLQPWPPCSSVPDSQHYAFPAEEHEGCSTFPPCTHTEPQLQKPSLPKRYTSLLPAEKIPPGILQGTHAAARNSHSSTWLEHQWPALGSHATMAASSAGLGGEPGTLPGRTHLRHPAPCCAPAWLCRVLHAEGALPQGSPQAVG